MIRIILVFILALVPSLSFAYEFTPDWSYSLSTNRAKQVAFRILYASFEHNGISITTNKDVLFAGSSQNAIMIQKDSRQLSLNRTSGSDYAHTWRLVLWPMYQNGDVYTIAYSVLLIGKDYLQPSGGPNSGYIYYLYYDSGVVSVENLFAGEAVVTFVDDSDFFPVSLRLNNMRYMSPSIKGVNVAYDTFYSENSFPDGRIKPGSVLEFIDLVNAFYTYKNSLGNNTSGVINYQDFLTGEFYNTTNFPNQLLSVWGSSSTSSYYTSLINMDTDAGSEPDFHEFYTAHNYLNPQDDWTYSGDVDFPSNGFEVVSFGPEALEQLEEAVGGGGGGAGGKVNEFGQQAQGQITDAIEEAVGDPSDLNLPVLDDNLPEEDRDDPETNDYFLREVKSATDDILPDGVSRFQALVNRLRSPDNRTIRPIEISMESDFSTLDLGLNKVFEGETVEFDWNIILEKYGAEMRLARMVVVFVMYGLVIIYVIKDNFLIGNNSTAGE